MTAFGPKIQGYNLVLDGSCWRQKVRSQVEGVFKNIFISLFLAGWTLSSSEACGILVRQSGIELATPALQGMVGLPTREVPMFWTSDEALGAGGPQGSVEEGGR